MGKVPSPTEVNLLSPIAWVGEERRRQNAKWGFQNHNALRWLGILMEEVGEASREVEQANYGVKDEEEWRARLQYELIQVAAVAVAWCEAIRRKEGSEKLPVCACNSCMARAEKGESNQHEPKENEDTRR